MCLFGDGGAGRIAAQQRADENARQSRITSGMSAIDRAFSGFNDDFYNKRAAAYSAFAMPQVERQARDARRQLVYALSRSGNLDSSAAIDRNADLDEEINQQRIGVTNTGIDQANQTRAQVENTRGNVVAQLNATGNDSAATAAAMRSVENLNQPGGYSPLGNLFAGFAQSLSGIGANAGNGYSGFAGRGSSLYGPSRSSQRVVG